MNTDQVSTEKTYYGIGEVAKMFNLTVSNIRFWEQEFPVLKPKKNRKGDRFFTRKDIEWLKVIYHLLKEEGYTIDGARKKLSQSSKGVSDKVELITSLKKVRSFLVSLKESVDPKKTRVIDPEAADETVSGVNALEEESTEFIFEANVSAEAPELGETLVDEAGSIQETDEVIIPSKESQPADEQVKEENEEPF